MSIVEGVSIGADRDPLDKRFPAWKSIICTEKRRGSVSTPIYSDGAFSTGERIAGAFVNDRLDWLPDRYPSIGEALVRLGAEWREGVVEVWTRNFNGTW